MRFGAFVPQGWRLDLVGIAQSDHWPTMLSVAQAIESAGYESLWVFDHFHTVPAPTQEPTYEAWTLMAALAATTSTVRLGQMCTCNGYRPPSYLAKVAASIDTISAGRLEMGIGAGWYHQEFAGYGYPFPSPAERLGQLAEAVEIMQRMWIEDVVEFEGRHYRLQGAICRPKPIQQPHIPFWVAGGGEQLTLRVAAKFAQYTNFAQTPEEFIHKSAILQKHCADVGRAFDDVVRSVNFTVVIAEDEAGVADRLGWMRSQYSRLVTDAQVERAMAMWGANAGTPEQIVEKLAPFAAAGMGYAIVNFPEAAYDTSGLELFAAAVVPALA
jgi:F420-dependent oxidoreductase-like protein